AMHRPVGVELLHQRQQLGLAHARGQMMIERLHADFGHRARFAGDIGLTGRIVAEQHHGKSGHDAMRGAQRLRLRFHRGAQSGGLPLPVNVVGPLLLLWLSRPTPPSSFGAPPQMQKLLPRPPPPAVISICRGASPSSCATSRRSASLAWPSNGAARTRALSTNRPSARRSTPSIASRPPRGVSRTSSATPPAYPTHRFARNVPWTRSPPPEAFEAAAFTRAAFAR